MSRDQTLCIVNSISLLYPLQFNKRHHISKDRYDNKLIIIIICWREKNQQTIYMYVQHSS